MSCCLRPLPVVGCRDRSLERDGLRDGSAVRDLRLSSRSEDLCVNGLSFLRWLLAVVGACRALLALALALKLALLAFVLLAAALLAIARLAIAGALTERFARLGLRRGRVVLGSLHL